MRLPVLLTSLALATTLTAAPAPAQTPQPAAQSADGSVSVDVDVRSRVVAGRDVKLKFSGYTDTQRRLTATYALTTDRKKCAASYPADTGAASTFHDVEGDFRYREKILAIAFSPGRWKVCVWLSEKSSTEQVVAVGSDTFRVVRKRR